MQVNTNSHKTAAKKYKYNDNLYSYLVDYAILLRLDPEIDNAKTAASGQKKQSKKYKYNDNLYSHVADNAILLRLDPEIDNAKTATASGKKMQSKKYNNDNFNLYSYVADCVVAVK